MSSASDVRYRLARPVDRFVSARVAGWRSGSLLSQALVLGVLVTAVVASFGLSAVDYDLMPMTAYFVWLLLGSMLLRAVPLVGFGVFTYAVATAALLRYGSPSAPSVALIVVMGLVLALLLYQASGNRTGLPGSLGDAMLVDLRDRLQAQGKVPPLPAGWSCESAMLAAHGGNYAGDFLVADLADGRRLEMVLVDVCGKGLAAATQALQFAGALGGLIGALPPLALFGAANDFLLRQFPDDSFATAAHVVVDLETGRYTIVSAGHPPALRWSPAEGEWLIDNARGTALGITSRPELTASEGVLEPGAALMFYTDGVVESRHTDIDEGIEWLRATARDGLDRGLRGLPRRIVAQVDRGDDDRAVLILARDG